MSSNQVGDREADFAWRVAIANLCHNAALGLNDCIKCRIRRTVLAIAGNGAINQVGVPCRDRLDAKAKLVECTGLEVLDQDVGAGEKRFKCDAIRISGEIQRQRLLSGVVIGKIAADMPGPRRPRARNFAIFGLDLDHVSAKIAQRPPDQRARGKGTNLDHPHTIEDTGRGARHLGSRRTGDS